MAEGIVAVAGGLAGVGVRQENDVAVAVVVEEQGQVLGSLFMILGCRDIVDGRKQTADAAGSLEGAAEVFAPGVLGRPFMISDF